MSNTKGWDVINWVVFITSVLIVIMLFGLFAWGFVEIISWITSK
jgi:hypothetical protein